MESRFCTNCGTALIARLSSTSGAVRQTCPACLTTVYDSPSVVVATLPVVGERVVLVRRATDPGLGLWSYPGGYLETGETLEEGAIRETREETGLEVALTGLIGIYSRPGGRSITVMFEAAAESEDWRIGPEVTEVKAFVLDSIPWKDLAFWTARYALEDWVSSREQRLPLPRSWRTGPPRR